MVINIASPLPITSRSGPKQKQSQQEAKHVAAFLYKMILRHGCPEEIVSDQGREFCNQLIDLLEQLTGFKHKITSAYHPQSNGLDERLNQTLKSKLQQLVNEHMDDWDELINNILFAYRSSRQDSTSALRADGGRLKPQKVCMYVCMYVYIYTCVCPD